MPNYSGWGNDTLAPLAYAGDNGAKEEIESRGNTVIASRQVIQKTVIWLESQVQNRCVTGDTVVIENGSIVSVNGEKIS